VFLIKSSLDNNVAMINRAIPILSSAYGSYGDNKDDGGGDDSNNDGDMVANVTGELHHGTSILKGNHIHHNRFGFYSVGIGNMIMVDCELTQ
jgi:hypothetical protein